MKNTESMDLNNQNEIIAMGTNLLVGSVIAATGLVVLYFIFGAHSTKSMLEQIQTIVRK